MIDAAGDPTSLLLSLTPGKDAPPPPALDEAVYGELRALAARLMRSESAQHTLQPTALVHEAYVRLIDQERVDWENRAQFLAISARIMRRVLVDHARARSADKRGGNRRRVTLLTDLRAPDAEDAIEIVALDRALARLETLEARVARVVELRAFSGLPMREVALVLGVSKRTADADWAFALRWLAANLGTTDE